MTGLFKIRKTYTDLTNLNIFKDIKFVFRISYCIQPSDYSSFPYTDACGALSSYLLFNGIRMETEKGKTFSIKNIVI